MTLQGLSRKDNSGGFMVVQYANGSYAHKMRVHFDKVTASDPTMTYQVASGTETTVFQTFANLCNLLKPYRDSSWAFTLSSIYLTTGPDPNISGYNLLVEQFGWASPTPIAGTGAAATTALQAASFEALNFHTIAGGRARFMIIGIGGFVLALPATVTPTSGGGASDQALVGYLTGANTAIRGHDGAKLTGGAHVTSGYQARLRRHYGQA